MPDRIPELTRVVGELRTEVAPLGPKIDQLAQRYRTRGRWFAAVLAALVVVVLALAGAAVFVELRTQADIAESNRKLCPMIALLVPDPGAEQPKTAYGVKLAEQARLLYDAYGCQKPAA